MAIKHRDLVFVALMFIFTLGIYYIYWTIKTKNEIKSLGCQIPSALLAFLPIIHFYFWYKYAQGFVDCAEKQKNNTSMVYLYTIALSLVPLLGMLVVQNKLNQLARTK